MYHLNLSILLSFVLLCVTNCWGSEPVSVPNDYLLCRRCGINIAAASTVVNLKSPAAESFNNQTLFGVDDVAVQAIRNPLGIQFNIVTAKGATCVGVGHKWQVENSWFPGYAWKICTCSRCSKHIGWIFEPLSTATSERVYASLKGFYAFILENIIGEAYSDSLLITPKPYAFR